MQTFGEEKWKKLLANFSATKVTSLPSLSLSHSLSLSLSHRAHLTHNKGSASALPIIPRRWDSAKQFRPASRWHLKITNTIDLWICHRNLRYWMGSTTEYQSDPQPWPKPKTASKLKPDKFPTMEGDARGRSCMHETNACKHLYWFKMAPDHPGIGGFRHWLKNYLPGFIHSFSKVFWTMFISSTVSVVY